MHQFNDDLKKNLPHLIKKKGLVYQHNARVHICSDNIAKFDNLGKISIPFSNILSGGFLKWLFSFPKLEEISLQKEIRCSKECLFKGPLQIWLFGRGQQIEKMLDEVYVSRRRIRRRPRTYCFMYALSLKIYVVYWYGKYYYAIIVGVPNIILKSLALMWKDIITDNEPFVGWFQKFTKRWVNSQIEFQFN